MIIATTRVRNRYDSLFFIGSVHDRLTYIYQIVQSSANCRSNEEKNDDYRGLRFYFVLLRLRFTCCSIGAGESNKNRRSRFATRRGVSSFRTRSCVFLAQIFAYRNFNRKEKNRSNDNFFIKCFEYLFTALRIFNKNNLSNISRK